MARTWTRRQASPPTSITEIARRYHAAAVALAQTLGLSVVEVLAQHRESVTAIFIETCRAELRLPAGANLAPLVREAPVAQANGPGGAPSTSAHAEVLADRPAVSPSANGDPRPQTIPLDAGLPCSGVSIEALRPGQLAMLLSKTASLVHADGDQWVPLLAALQAEKARRQAPGHIVPVQAPATGPAEAPAQEEGTAAAETTKPDRETAARQRWGALSRRSMRAGLSPTVWERLRQGDYPSAERVIVALESASTTGAG